MNSGLTDSFGRTFEYLRLSVTHLCNYQCIYCLPNGCRKTATAPVTSTEVSNLVHAFARLGVSKVRLTGGEPTVRSDLKEIVAAVAQTPGIRKVALTTNGSKLTRRQLEELKDAGLSAINFSVDSLHEERFREITGHPGLTKVRQAIADALDLGFEPVKINVVLMGGLNDSELDAYEAYLSELPISVRYIELMQTAENSALFKKHYLAGDSLKQQLLAKGWSALDREAGDGPATVYAKSGYLGTIGVVAPYSKGFCDSCNRLRVTSLGALRLCLFGEADFDLRSLLQSESQSLELEATIQSLLLKKKPHHRLHEGMYGNAMNLAAYGG